MLVGQFLHTILIISFIITTSALYCDKIKEKYSPTRRYVSQHGSPKNITVYWDSDPASAAAALLSVVYQYALGFQFVRLQQTQDRNLYESSCKTDGMLKEVKINLSTAREPQLHMRLSKYVKNKTACLNNTKWSSYIDDVLLSECGFRDANDSDIDVINVMNPNSRNFISEKVMANLKETRLSLKEIERTELCQTIRTSTRSLLFLDYQILWEDAPDVNVVKHPLMKIHQKRYDTNIISTVGDGCLMRQFAPQIFAIADKYDPQPNVIRSILEMENDSLDIEEAACKWAIAENFTTVHRLIQKYKPKKKTYVILCIICEDDPDIEKYEELLFFLGMNRYKTRDAKFIIITRIMDLVCSDPKSILKDINDYMLHNVTSNFIGIIIGGLPNMADVAKIMKNYNLPVVFYDEYAIDAPANKVIASDDEGGFTSPLWVSAGQSLHLALALQHFVYKMGFYRITVISSQTQMASFLRNSLNDLRYLGLRDHPVPSNLTDVQALKTLYQIKAEGARVIVINTDYKDASTILTAAVKLKMNMDDRYIWILKEWRQTTPILNIKHFLISFWCKRGNNIVNTGTGRLDYLEKVDQLWPNKLWAPQTVAFINAVLTIVEGFEGVILKYPEAQDDTQSAQVIRQFKKSLTEVPVKGITHRLTYKRHILEEVIVYVDEWYGSPKLLMQMQVNASSQQVITDHVTNGFKQLLKDIRSSTYFKEDVDQKPSSQSKISYAVWVVLTIIAVLPLFAIMLLLKYIRRRKETV